MKEILLVTGANTHINLGAGKWAIAVVATTWDTASVDIRSLLFPSTADVSEFTTSTRLLNPGTSDVLAITANRGDLVIEGPTTLVPFVSTIGSATGLKFRYEYATVY